MLSKDEIADIVRDFSALSMDIEEMSRIGEPISEAQRQFLVGMREADIADPRLEVGRGDYSRVSQALAAMGRRHLTLSEFEQRQLG